MIDSPSYTLNHEEVAKALEEGIVFAEGLTPTRIEVDKFGHASAVTFQDGIQLPARSVLIAAGTQPNTVLAREEGVSLELDGKYFLATDETGAPVKPERHTAKPKRPQVLAAPLSRRALHELLRRPASVLFRQRGEGHGQREAGLPGRFEGSGEPRCRLAAWTTPQFMAKLNRDLRAVVHEVRRLTPTIVEVVLRAPVAARRFEPGQFYRMQNFEALALQGAGHHARDGRPGAHRRLGRPRKRPDLGDRARDGRLGGPARLPAAGRAGDPDGPDRDADRDSRTARRWCSPAAASATRCSSPSAARCAPPARRSSTSPATSISPTATASTTSRRPPTWSSGAATKRPASRRGGRRTALRRQHRAGDAGLRLGRARRPADPLFGAPTASSPSAPTA